MQENLVICGELFVGCDKGMAIIFHNDNFLDGYHWIIASVGWYHRPWYD